MKAYKDQYCAVFKLRTKNGCLTDNQITISGCPSKFVVVRTWNKVLVLILYLNLASFGYRFVNIFGCLPIFKVVPAHRQPKFRTLQFTSKSKRPRRRIWEVQKYPRFQGLVGLLVLKRLDIRFLYVKDVQISHTNICMSSVVSVGTSDRIKDK